LVSLFHSIFLHTQLQSAGFYATPEEYIGASILRPDEYIAPDGIPAIMPQHYAQQFNIGDIRDIIAFLKEQDQ
jgi:hypothetical protein